MKIKVGKKVYDGKDEPIMVILTKRDKRNIANMAPTATKYAQFVANKFTMEEIDKWMGGKGKMEECEVGYLEKELKGRKNE